MTTTSISAWPNASPEVADNGQDTSIECQTEFERECEAFARSFDEIEGPDKFQGLVLEAMCSEFMSKHAKSISQLARKSSLWSEEGFEKNDLFMKNTPQVLDEDERLLDEKWLEQNYPKSQIGREQMCAWQIYRRAARACFLRTSLNIARNNIDDNKMEPVMWARRVLRLNPYDLISCYCYGGLLGWNCEKLANPREKTLVAHTFKKSCDRLIAMCPQDAGGHNLLGRYYYNVAKTTWLERTFASTLLGCKLEGTFEAAENCFRKAYELKSDYMPIGLWMARTLSARKRPISEVREWLELALSLPCVDPEDELERQDALELKSKLFESTKV